MSVEFFVAAIVTIVGLSTPILLAGLGELVVEKSGVLNLGVEGMMLIGAIAGFAASVVTGNPWVAVVAAAVAGALSASLFGFFVLTLNSNQVATGLALTIFGTGLSSLLGLNYTGRIVMQFGSVFPPALSKHPIWQVLFGYSPIVYFAIIMVGLVSWFLGRTRSGLILRAVGQNDLSAHSIGYSVIGVRYAAVAFGGAMAGIGGAYFFGILMALELYAKASGFSFLPSQFWAAMPYLMTVVVLAIISSRESGGGNAPACLGKPFLPAN